MPDNTPKHQLIWFRSDLRITDNPSLFCARETNKPLIAIFFVCEKQWQQHDYGVAKVGFMMRQVADLRSSLAELDIPLLVKSVDYFAHIPDTLAELVEQHKIEKIWCNKECELNEIQRDAACETALADINVDFEALHDQCIVPPNTVKTKDGNMFKVFSPFFRRWQTILEDNPVECLPTPEKQSGVTIQSDDIPALQLYDLTTLPANITEHFPTSETHAMQLLHDFVDNGLNDYKERRDTPSLDGTSSLSPYLSIGAISARQCYVAAKQFLNEHPASNGANCWISELCWREFYRHIIVEWPRIVQHHAFNEVTDKKVTWNYDHADFDKWCKGETGVPIIDAAMRCLNATGFMHNRLRMVVAMFLTKNLLIDWRWGEKYFMETLVDADFASNNGGWQWSASVGTDAAPYFRIMNPFSQGKTHDVDAVFIKRWVPELAKVEPKVIHDPNKLVKLCAAVGYVTPMVDVKATRAAAIEAFKAAKST